MAVKPGILHVITRLDRGGTVGVVLPLAREATKRGWRCRIITGSTVDGQQLQKEESDLDIRLLPSLIRPIRPWHDLQTLIALIREIRRGQYSLIHTHTSKAGALGRLAAIMQRHPAIVHTPHGHVFAGYFPGGLARAIINTERWLSRRTDRLIGVSSEEISETLDHGVGSPGRFRLIPSAVDFPAVLPAREDVDRIKQALQIPQGTKVIGFLGRLDPVKGPDLLLDAMIRIQSAIPDLHLVMAGSGILEEELRRKADDLIPGRVTFTGWQKQVWPVLSVMDLLVLPSRMEGLGKSALEGLYAGLPVVATAVGGLRGLYGLAPGRVCMAENPDAYSVARSLQEALRLSVQSMDENEQIRRLLRRKFGVGRMIADTFAIYRELLHGQ